MDNLIIPKINFKESWDVSVSQNNFGNAGEFFGYRIKNKNDFVSITLQKQDKRLKEKGFPDYYWVVYPYDNGEINIDINDTERLIEVLSEILDEDLNTLKINVKERWGDSISQSNFLESSDYDFNTCTLKLTFAKNSIIEVDLTNIVNEYINM